MIISMIVFMFTACGENQKTYTVSFDANGGSGTMASQTFTENAAQNLKTNAFTKDGRYFLGWATSADGSALYANGAAYTATADTTLYAVWNEAQPVIADYIPMASKVSVGGSAFFTTYYTANIDGTLYYGTMVKIDTVSGKDYQLTVSDTTVYGWILCDSEGEELATGLFSGGKGKFTAESGTSYVLIGFEQAPGGSFTVEAANYVATPGESDKYAITLTIGAATGVKTLKSYNQTWYAITVPDDGKTYGLTVTMTGTTNNLVVYLFGKKSDGSADRQNYKFSYASATATAAFNNFKFGNVSSIQGTDPFTGAGQYYVSVMASGAEYSYNLMFTEIQ